MEFCPSVGEAYIVKRSPLTNIHLLFQCAATALYTLSSSAQREPLAPCRRGGSETLLFCITSYNCCKFHLIMMISSWWCIFYKQQCIRQIIRTKEFDYCLFSKIKKKNCILGYVCTLHIKKNNVSHLDAQKYIGYKKSYE